ncbi:MAG: DUF433 domain-containing protein [Pseudonocardia sp.]|nr:DUF433 domain-containing protein [Pseudonocardia sp.]
MSDAPALDDDLDVSRFALTREVAARVAGLSTRQLDYWAGTGLIGPSIDRRLTPGTRVRLYAYTELLEVMVASELRGRGISLQHVRTVVDHLRARGYAHPLHQLAFAVKGRNVYFQHDDGTWEGDLKRDQIVIHEVLDLRPLRRRIAEASKRDESLAGRVERRRGTKGNKPLMAGTRIPVETVQRYLSSGRSVDQVLESFPVLTREDVEGARDGAA